MIEALKNKIKQLPKKPGVYIYKNAKGKIIYIGKALSLKNRVSSYFHQKHHDVKTIELVENIADLQTILVDNEFEALLLEAKLIKQHRPKYNIQAKDGKSYLYIIIGKEYPHRIFASRIPESEEKILTWFGPFPSSREVKEILKIIRRIFPFRSCNNLPKRPCLYYHMKLCPGVCGLANNSTYDEYSKTITRIRQILSGKTKKLVKSLQKEMKSAAKAMDFEQAQKIKFQIDTLSRLTSGWKSTPKENQDKSMAIEEIKNILIKFGGINLLAINKIEGYDVSNLSSQIIVGSMVAFSGGEPETSSYRKFNLKGFFDFSTDKFFDSQDDPRGIKQILERRLRHPEWILPQMILIDGGKTQVGAAFEALKEKGLDTQIAVIGLTKENEILIIPQIKNRFIIFWKSLRLPRNSSALRLLQHIRDESHRFAQKYYKQIHTGILRS